MKDLKRFDVIAKLGVVRGFLDDPDTHEAVLNINEATKGKWVYATDALKLKTALLHAEDQLAEAVEVIKSLRAKPAPIVKAQSDYRDWDFQNQNQNG